MPTEPVQQCDAAGVGPAHAELVDDPTEHGDALVLVGLVVEVDDVGAQHAVVVDGVIAHGAAEQHHGAARRTHRPVVRLGDRQPIGGEADPGVAAVGGLHEAHRSRSTLGLPGDGEVVVALMSGGPRTSGASSGGRPEERGSEVGRSTAGNGGDPTPEGSLTNLSHSWSGVAPRMRAMTRRDDGWDDDAPIYPPAPIPAHERTWRHPSEIG